MGNLSCGRSSTNIHTRNKDSRSESVDRARETKTSGQLTVQTTVSQDKPTVIRPHTITFYYPPDTPSNVTMKFPVKPVHKSCAEAIVLGRGVDVDVLLNEEHMSRQFVEVRCKCDENGEPKWYIKNMSEKKAVWVSFNDSSACLKFQEEAELQDGCELDIESLTFLVKTEDGDFGITGFDLKIRKMKRDMTLLECSKRSKRGNSEVSIGSCNSMASTSLVRHGSTSTKISENRILLQQHSLHGATLTEESSVEDYELDLPHPGHFNKNANGSVRSNSSYCFQDHCNHSHGSSQTLVRNAGHQGQVFPTVRGHTNQDRLLQTVGAQLPTTLPISNCRYYNHAPSEQAAPFMPGNLVMPGNQFNPVSHSFNGTSFIPSEQISHSHPSSPEFQHMSPSANRFPNALPELLGSQPYDSVQCGPFAFHPQPAVLSQHPPHRFPNQFISTQRTPPLLHRSQSLFARGRNGYVELKRRSSCDGAEMVSTLPQPESASIPNPLTQNGATASFQTMHETHRKPLIDDTPTVNLHDQMENLKLGYVSQGTSYRLNEESDEMFDHTYPNTFHALDYTAISKELSLHSNSRHQAFLDALPASAGFSTLTSAADEDMLCGKVTDHASSCASRQPQENDERKPHEHECQCTLDELAASTMDKNTHI